MKITIKGCEIKLNNKEVKQAKKIVSKFIKSVDDKAKEQRTPTFYFTMLVVMHLMSQEALDNIEPNALKLLMDSFSESMDNTRE